MAVTTEVSTRQRAGGRLPLVAAGVLGVVLIAAAAVVLVYPRLPFGHGGMPANVTDLQQTPAPDFQLTDASGNQVSMSQMRGKVVALTFIYTSCPDVCPLITANMQQAYQQLGSDAAHVSLMAITVDPETDTPQRIAQYSQAMKMDGRWEFLTGTRDQLGPVWAGYWVAPIPLEQAQQLATLGPAAVQTDPAFQGGHTAPIFLIDAQGRERGLLDPTFSPSELVQGLRSLL